MVKVFLSYAHRDEELKEQLGVHLGILKREGVIDLWQDRQIGAGRDVHAAIGDSLEAADIVLLLVSPDFLASDYCFEIEMKRALARHQSGAARVIPVILRLCDWHRSPIGHLRATPKDGMPVSKFPDRDEAFLQVSRDIRGAAEEIRKAWQGRPAAAPPPDLPGLARLGSERDLLAFSRTSFNIIATIFEAEVDKLNRSKRHQAELSKPDGDTLQAQYTDMRGERRTCTVWRTAQGEILYSPSLTSRAATEGFSLHQDLLSGLPILRSRSGKELLALFAAGHLWKLFTGNIADVMFP
jgi:hypothetical protein